MSTSTRKMGDLLKDQGQEVVLKNEEEKNEVVIPKKAPAKKAASTRKSPAKKAPVKKASAKKTLASVKKKVATPKVVTNKSTPILGEERIKKVDPYQLVVNEEWNPRIDYGDIEELAASIMAQGVRNPIRIFFNSDGQYELTHGFRRLRAIKWIAEKHPSHKIELVSAKLEPRGISDKERLIHQLADNEGEGFKPLEEAMIYKRLLDYGYSVKDICKLTGRQKALIDQRLILIKASPKLKDAVSSGKVPIGMAVQIIGSSDSSEEMDNLTKEASISNTHKSKRNMKAKLRAKAGGKVEEKTNTTRISAIAARNVLSALVEDYISLVRSAHRMPEYSEWKRLDNNLRKLRNMKRKGKLG